MKTWPLSLPKTLCLAVAAAVLWFAFIQPRIGVVFETTRLEVAQARAHSIGHGIRAYRGEYGALPSGDTLSIAKQLRGENPRGLKFIYLRPSDTDEEGWILDPWGNRFQIYLSGEGVVVCSPGKDGTFEWDLGGDDVAFRLAFPEESD